MENTVMNKKTNGWLNTDEKKKNLIFDFCDEYIKFLNNGKTEREASKIIVDELENNGFKNINTVDKLDDGDKVYMLNRDKSVYAAIIGSDSMVNGINLVGAHIDSPRLDLKPNPLFIVDKIICKSYHLSL